MIHNHRREVLGILLIVLSLFILLSFITYNPLETPDGLSSAIARQNIMGVFGVYTSYFLMKFSFGWGTLVFPAMLCLTGYTLFSRRDWEDTLRLNLYFTGFGIWTSLILAWYGHYKGGLWTAEYPGAAGYIIWKFITDIFGIYASVILIWVIFVLLLSSLFRVSIYDSIKKGSAFIKDQLERLQEKRKMDNLIVESPSPPVEPKSKEPEDKGKPAQPHEKSRKGGEIGSRDQEAGDSGKETDAKEQEEETVSIDEPPLITQFEPFNQQSFSELDEVGEITIEEEAEIEEGNLDAEKERKARYRQYKLPILDYLSDPPQIKNIHTEEELRDKANQLVHALETYGVSGRVVRISPGPVITLFEIEPAEGVRVNKFTNLADDLARVMKAQRVRIIAPIPGSKSVGVEIPNDNPATVFLKNIINSEQYVKADSKLSISLGKTTTGEAYVFDLGKMPHLLVAGATGAGKSVCINTMIVSILYKSKPDEVKFILVDPKKLELATYKSLVGYHLITAPNLDEYVMTTPENAVGILDSAIVEMERRFQVFADARVRNISEYHDRRKDNPELEPAPYIVVVIDELADLMLTSGRAVEEPIARLAQKARAVGIHLIVATQRPSVDVITGVIKSNFPARIAFQVSSKVDSRTIIDQMGAEKLLGRGDMLFLLPGTASPIRLHNAFITLEEIEAVMEHISSQPKPEEIHLPETRKEKVEGDFSLDDGQDELLKDAAILVIQTQQASVSLLQRKFRIGYSRAGRLIDELEALGIISGYSGSKARDVLVDESYLENIFGE